MQSVIVPMPDGKTFELKRLLSQANIRQREREGYVSVGLTMTPRATGRAGRNFCPFATKGCAASCFSAYDRLAWPQNKRVAVARTQLLARDPRTFYAMLFDEIGREDRRATRLDMTLVCRLNIVSDVAFERERPDLFAEFPDVQFMDYTKDVSRVLGPLPENYHLTFSRSEHNEADCRRVLASGKNVTVVFRKLPFPSEFWDFPVVDGDRDDLRFLDPSPRVVGLKAKGKGAREDKTGFVV